MRHFVSRKQGQKKLKKKPVAINVLQSKVHKTKGKVRISANV